LLLIKWGGGSGVVVTSAAMRVEGLRNFMISTALTEMAVPLVHLAALASSQACGANGTLLIVLANVSETSSR
jgi:hypothetical protein